MRTAKLGSEHPDTLFSKDNLALVYYDQEKYDQAEPLYEQVLQARAAKLGADHPDTLNSKHNLARLYQAQGKYDRAESLYQEVLQALTAILGPDHPRTLGDKHNLATLYQAQGKYDRAEPLYREVLQATIAKLGPDHPDTFSTKNYLAFLYHQQKRHDRAEPLLREVTDVVKRRAGADSLPYAGQLAMLSANLLQQNKLAEAEKIARACLAIREKKEPDAWTTFSTISMLGGAQLGQKKYAEAEPLLVQSYEGMKQREAKIPKEGKIRLTEALERLVQLYEATGKKGEAAKWRKKLEAQNIKDAPPELIAPPKPSDE